MVPACQFLSSLNSLKKTCRGGKYIWRIFVLKFRRVTIRGAQPSARLSEEISLLEGSAGVSPRALRGLSEGSAGSLRGSAGFSEGFRG